MRRTKGGSYNYEKKKERSAGLRSAPGFDLLLHVQGDSLRNRYRS